MCVGFVFACTHAYTSECHSMHVEIRGQGIRICSLLLLRGFREKTCFFAVATSVNPLTHPTVLLSFFLFLFHLFFFCWNSLGFAEKFRKFPVPSCLLTQLPVIPLSFLRVTVILCLWVAVCMHACATHVCLVPTEARRGCWILWSWSYHVY